MERKYGKKPEVLGKFDIKCDEMMFYMYLPIKMKDSLWIKVPPRLKLFQPLIDTMLNHEMGYIENKYIYLTVKNIYVTSDNIGNRPGYHSDGFQTDDLNYIWCDKYPTVFSVQNFNISEDCDSSMKEMAAQARVENEIIFPEKTLTKLDQYVFK